MPGALLKVGRTGRRGDGLAVFVMNLSFRCGPEAGFVTLCRRRARILD